MLTDRDKAEVRALVREELSRLKPELFRVAEAAHHYGVSAVTIYAWIKEKRLSTTRRNGYLYVQGPLPTIGRRRAHGAEPT